MGPLFLFLPFLYTIKVKVLGFGKTISLQSGVRNEERISIIFHDSQVSLTEKTAFIMQH